MLLHRESSRVISDVFELYASSAERAKLIREFYGKEMVLFTSVEDGRSLSELLKDADAVKRKRVLESMKQHLLAMFVVFAPCFNTRVIYSF
jgi:pumilio family protein 6